MRGCWSLFAMQIRKQTCIIICSLGVFVGFFPFIYFAPADVHRTVQLPKGQFLHIEHNYADECARHTHTHTHRKPVHSCWCKRLFIHHFLLFTRIIVQATSAEGHGHNGQSIKLTTHTLTMIWWPCPRRICILLKQLRLLVVQTANSQQLVPPVTLDDILAPTSTSEAPNAGLVPTDRQRCRPHWQRD